MNVPGEGKGNEKLRGGAAGAEGGFKLLGTCAGHRRGVWTVRFSRNDKVVASGSADRTIKLWSLDDFTCLKVRPSVPPPHSAANLLSLDV